MQLRMTEAIVSSIIMLAAFGFLRCNAQVKKSNSTYQCCGHPTIPFDQHCKSSRWSKDGRAFAVYRAKDSHKCVSPCKEIKSGLMILDQCADVELCTMCDTEMDTVEEHRINFLGQTCPHSLSATGNQAAGSVGLLLLSVMTKGLFA